MEKLLDTCLNLSKNGSSTRQIPNVVSDLEEQRQVAVARSLHRCRHQGISGFRLQSLRAMPGLVLAVFLLACSSVSAQNLNDLLRVIIPPLAQPSPRVYYYDDPPPRVYQPAPRHYRQWQPPQQPRVNPKPSVPYAEILRTQEMLNDLGSDAGTPDGIAGRKTMAALNAFQRDNDLPVSSRVDRSSVATLSAVHRHVANTDTEEIASSADIISSAGYSSEGQSQPMSAQPQQPTAFAATSNSRQGRSAVDCTKAVSPTEITLCSDVVLGTLDSQLLVLYAQAQAQQGPETASLQDEQLQWLNRRNQCGADRSCLLKAYAERIGALSSASSITPDSPGTSQDWQGANQPLPEFGSNALPTPSATISGPQYDLGKLAAPSPTFKPIVFEYFQEIPLVSDVYQMPGQTQTGPLKDVMDLMVFAREAPKFAKNEPSEHRGSECHYIKKFFSEDAIKPYIKSGFGNCFLGTNEFEECVRV